MKLDAYRHTRQDVEETSPGSLFADDLDVGATFCIGMQRAINCANEFCDECELKT
jgi:hypothetical protein